MERALARIRDRLPPEALVLTAAYAPIRWRCVLQPFTMQKVQAMIKECVLQCVKASKAKHHWLEEYITTRNGDALTVSLFTLAEAVSPYMHSRRQQLDSDAVCALFMIRNCDVSRPYSVPYNDAEIDSDQDENDDGGEEYMRCTPLYAAVEKGKLDLVHLFLSGGAATNGLQSHIAHGEDGETVQTPLYTATCLGQCAIVAYLLEARADPNDVGSSHDLCGEGVHPDGGQHHDEETPLWHATRQACESDPASSEGIIRRKLLRMLLKYGADPQKKGKTEHFFGGCGSDEDSDSEVSGFKDEEGCRHTGESETTPLEYAKKCMNRVPDTYCHQPNPNWAGDVYKLLDSAVGIRSAS